MLGMGSGQPNRRESLRIAMKKAGDEVKGAALASDAFFPFGRYLYLGYTCTDRGNRTLAESEKIGFDKP